MLTNHHAKEQFKTIFEYYCYEYNKTEGATYTYSNNCIDCYEHIQRDRVRCEDCLTEVYKTW